MVELKDKTKVIFHKGTHTIGGTLVEVSHEDSRIFFDLGSVFDSNLKEKNMDELLEKNLVSYVDGLYDPKSFKKTRKINNHGFKYQAAFISHVHLDHTSVVNFIDPEVPVFASEDTVKVLEAVSIDNDFVFPFTKDQESLGRNLRKIEKVSYNETVEIGKIKVTFIPVDHDAYGACGFLIETPNLRMGYTGDIRIHGFRPELTKKFIKTVRDCDLLITEGVSFSFNKLYEDDGKTLREEKVVGDFVNTIRENKDRQISFNYYPTNFERIESIYKNISGIRKLVLTSFGAYLLKKVSNLDVYYYKINDKNYGLDPSLEISLEDILKNREDYLFQMDVKKYNLISKLHEGGLYIHSDAEPLGEYIPFYKVFINNLERKNIEFKKIATSGHAPTRDLYEIIKEINPKLLAPIHSFNPEWVYYNSNRLLNPFDGDELLF